MGFLGLRVPKAGTNSFQDTVRVQDPPRNLSTGFGEVYDVCLALEHLGIHNLQTSL